jgi:hypothetical protein
MARFKKFQTNFSAGWMSSQAAAREDLTAYQNGAETLTNVWPKIAGGVARRPGTDYLANLGGRSRIEPFFFRDGQEYVFAFQASQIKVYDTDGALLTTITGCPWGADDLFDLRYSQSGDVMIVVHPDYKMQKITRTGASTFTRADFAFEAHSSGWPRYEPFSKFADDAITLTPSATTGSITLTTSAAHWVAGHVGSIVRYKGKQVEVTAYTSATVVSGTVRETLASTTADADWDENVFSAANGYARSVVFYSRRLVFGGSRDLPEHVFMSKTNLFFNFDLGTSLDDESIWSPLGADEVNVIQHVVAGRHLQILTDRAEWYLPETNANPVTPSNFSPRKQTPFGANRVRPFGLDGATVFVQRNGRAVRELLFSDIEQAYSAESVNLLADDVITGVDDAAVFRGSADTVVQFGVFVSHTDGYAAIFHAVRSEKIAGWMRWMTEGDYDSVCVTDDKLFFSVKRTVNSVDVYYLERMSVSRMIDCAVDVTRSGSTWSGAGHLGTETVRVVSLDATYDYGDYTLNGSGEFTYESTTNTLEAGLYFTPVIKDMRASTQAGVGSIATTRKRVVSATVVLEDTRDCVMAGQQLVIRNVTDDLSLAPDALTGIFETYPLGWDRYGQVTITQQAALPMTVLGLAKEVAF